MKTLSRRSFVSALGAGTAGLAIGPLIALNARRAEGATLLGRGFGPLTPMLPLNTADLQNSWIGDLRDRPLLALPEGFEYWAISCTGDVMSDGQIVAGDPDGMAAFRGPRGATILVRNHELAPVGNDAGRPAVIAPVEKKYDPVGRGGTSTIVLDDEGQLVKHFGSLAGTYNNCAGGPTPWGTWITCEENTSVPPSNTVTKRHGYNFEVPAFCDGFTDPLPLKAMGRFNHEAIAVDPNTCWIYQTEDRDNGCFYRFRPTEWGDLSSGVLEALVVKGILRADTRSKWANNLGVPLETEWVVIDDVDPASDNIRSQAQRKGAAIFSRGEGAFWGNGGVYFVCTDGGDAKAGQVFFYDCNNDKLTLFLESVPAAALTYTDPSWDADSIKKNGGFVVAAPDNVTVGPDGRVYLCEDGDGIEKIVGVNRAGELFDVVRNQLNDNEFAGVCFSPAGEFMFVNIQDPGITLVIAGPWRRGSRFPRRRHSR
jgi:secreted PhoX family phosphatase